jgi:hypothetical protein
MDHRYHSHVTRVKERIAEHHGQGPEITSTAGQR